MSLRMSVLQKILVTVAQRQSGKPFDPVKARERSASWRARFKPKKGVTETREVIGGIPARRFSSGHAQRGTFFHLHGGGYVDGSSAVARLYSGICQDGGPDIVSLDYRLAPEHPYPAAVDDALAGYRALLETVPAGRILVGGESAGGNLAIALVQRILAEGLPRPVAIVPIFPWSDLTHTSSAWTANAGRDILTKSVIDGWARSYSGDLALDDPRVSPQLGPFEGFPPALIHVGTRDSLLEDSRVVVARLREAGVDVEHREFEGAVHGFTVLPIPEARASMADVRDFVHRHLPV